MVDIKEVAENIYQIDNEIYWVRGWGSVYLIKEEGKALIDTGPTTSAPIILEGMAKVGVSPEDINYIIATHIHLDHSGGAGFLLPKMPRAKVIVHPRGARHLIDPTRLVASMVSVQGEATKKMFGEVVPVAEDRIQVVGEGEKIDLGCEQILRMINAPGHAPHELCVYESRNNGVFTGDAAGMFLGDGISFPLTPPPSFDAEVYTGTLEKLADLAPSRLYVAHFGATTRVQEHFQSVIEELRLMAELAARAAKAGKLDGLAEKLIAQKSAKLAPLKGKPLLYQYVVDHAIPTNVSGFIKYYQEKQSIS